MCVHMYMYVCVCMYVCMYVYVCMYEIFALNFHCFLKILTNSEYLCMHV